MIHIATLLNFSFFTVVLLHSGRNMPYCKIILVEIRPVKERDKNSTMCVALYIKLLWCYAIRHSLNLSSWTSIFAILSTITKLLVLYVSLFQRVGKVPYRILFYPLYEHLKQIFGKLENKKSTFFRRKVPKNTHSHTKSYICTIPMCAIPI